MLLIHKKRQFGFTIIESIVVIVTLALLAVYAIIKGISSSDVTLGSQSMKMAADLRHVQTLASTWGVSLVVNASGHVYSVSCKSGALAPACNSSPVIDPATGQAFSVDLQAVQQGVTFVSPTTSVLTIDSLGKPNAAATYTLSSGGATSTVTVSATTGKVTP